MHQHHLLVGSQLPIWQRLWGNIRYTTWQISTKLRCKSCIEKGCTCTFIEVS